MQEKKKKDKDEEEGSIAIEEMFRNPIPLCGDIRFEFYAKGV